MLSSFSFSDTTVGFLIEGKFDTETVDSLIVNIENKLKTYDKINFNYFLFVLFSSPLNKNIIFICYVV